MAHAPPSLRIEDPASIEMDGIEVRESPIGGLGVFALRDFVAGERIRRVHIVREVTDDAPLQEERGELLHHCAYPDGKVVLWGCPDRHVNHSCPQRLRADRRRSILHPRPPRDRGRGEITFG